MAESCCANTAEKDNQKDLFLHLLHKNVHTSPYPTLSKHMSEINMSEAAGSHCGHDKRHGFFFLRTAFCLSEPKCHLSSVFKLML